MRRLLTLLMLAAAFAGSPASGQVIDTSRYDIAHPTPRGAMREMATDRPDKTESPYTVDAGHYQFELDFMTYTTDRHEEAGKNTNTETVGIAPINLKVGLTNGADLQVVFESYIRERVTDQTAGTTEQIDGFGDIIVRLKQNLWGNDGGKTALALMPFVKLPTNSNDLGADAAEFGIIVPLALGVSNRVGIGLMTEVDLVRESDGQAYSPVMVNSATVAIALTERLGMYAEVFTERSTEQGAKWIVSLDTGLTYAVSGDLQLDAGINLGVTEAADDLNLFVGLSRRF